MTYNTLYIRGSIS